MDFGYFVGMDLLSEIISSANWKNDLLVKDQIFKSFGYFFPCEKSGGFHIITQGSCYARFLKKEIHLKKGDLLFITRGIHHELLSDPKAKVVTIDRMKIDLQKPDNLDLRQSPVTSFVSVRYEIPAGPMHPLFHELPDFIYLPSEKLESHHALTNVIQILSKELELKLGGDLIVQRLTDIMLYYLIRIWLLENPMQNPGWVSAFHDKLVLTALEAMHKRINFDWNLDNLSKSIGVSRATLANRFRDVLGIPPIEYLAKLRMEKAKQMFQKDNLRLEEIAQNVGYSSAFSFSKAYKRIYGSSPLKEWKKVI